MDCIHIKVGSMLARSDFVGMREPQIVGRVKSIVPTSFLCRSQNNNNTLWAEFGDEEADNN